MADEPRLDPPGSALRRPGKGWLGRAAVRTPSAAAIRTFLAAAADAITTPAAIKTRSRRSTRTVHVITKLHALISVPPPRGGAAPPLRAHLNTFTWVRWFRLTSPGCWSRCLAGMYCKLMTDALCARPREAGGLGLGSGRASLSPNTNTSPFPAFPSNAFTPRPFPHKLSFSQPQFAFPACMSCRFSASSVQE